MSDEPQNAEVLAPKSSLAATITDPSNFDFRSIVTVVTARAESHLRGESARLRTEIKEKEGLVKVATRRLEDEVQTATNAHFEVVMGDRGPILTDILQMFIIQFSGEAKVEISTSLDLEEETWEARLTLKNFDLNNYYNRNVQSGAVTLNFADYPEVVTAASELSNLKQETKDAKARAIEIRRQLSDLGSLERQVSAAFVEKRLAETEDGKALLDQIGEVADQAVQAWDPTLNLKQLLSGSVD